MSSIPTIVPVSDLRRDAAGLMDAVGNTHEPVVITQHGRPKAVLQDIDSFQQMQRKVEIAELLARGNAEIEAGVSIPASDVMAEARAMISGQ